MSAHQTIPPLGHVHEVDRDCCGHLRPPEIRRRSLRTAILEMNQSRRIAAYFLLWWVWFVGAALLAWPVSWVAETIYKWLGWWK